jgi:hypothetical protein
VATRRRITVAVLALLLCLAAPAIKHASPAAASTLPHQLSDAAFWQLATDFSEPNGYFRSDNFLSNERAYQRVIPELQKELPTDGVYLGVGPEQNFTYIAALRPRLAFIVDIRRGNLQEQLLYKAFFELSADRAQFLSRLFARPRPTRLSADATVEELFAAYSNVEPSDALFAENFAAAKDQLISRHKFGLTEQDVSGLAYVYNAFYKAGPDLNYSFLNGAFGNSRFGGPFPTYADLMTETDGQGNHRGYLASETEFRIVKRLETDNAVVPLVGDFGGPKALRAVGRYLADHSATVTAFYTSNVEQYLFQSDAWQKFYANVSTLPVDARSTFIRSISNRGFQFQYGSPGFRASTRICSIADLVRLFEHRKITGYQDVIEMSR